MNQPFRWAIVASAAKYDSEQILRICSACGIDALEYSHKGVDGMGESELVALRQRYDDAGITINSFHLPFAKEDDIASFYESVRRDAVRKMSHWIRIAGHLGTRVVIQHPSTNRHPAEENGLDRFFEQLYKSLEDLLPAAREVGVIIGLENMPQRMSGSPRFFSHSEHMRRLAREVTDPNVGFVYDTGHASLSSDEDALEVLKAMGERVVAWHLADNAGDRDTHLAPGHGEVNWDGVFQFAAEIGLHRPMTMEAPPWGAGPDYSVNTWQRTIQGLDELARQALEKRNEHEVS